MENCTADWQNLPSFFPEIQRRSFSQCESEISRGYVAQVAQYAGEVGVGFHAQIWPLLARPRKKTAQWQMKIYKQLPVIVIV